MNRISLVTIAALTLSACSAGSTDHPLAPSTARVSSRSAVALPLRGTVDASESSVYNPVANTITVHLTADGVATHLGRFDMVADFVVDLNSVTSAGTITLTAANGDELRTTFTGVGVVTSVTTIVETATIVGGTGRFAGATGGFTLRRVLDEATGISAGSFDGTITFGH